MKSFLRKIDMLHDEFTADREISHMPGKIYPIKYDHEQQKFENQRRRGLGPLNPYDEVPVISGMFL